MNSSLYPSRATDTAGEPPSLRSPALIQQFQAKASEDNGTYPAHLEGHGATGDATRPSVGGDTDAPIHDEVFQ